MEVEEEEEGGGELSPSIHLSSLMRSESYKNTEIDNKPQRTALSPPFNCASSPACSRLTSVSSTFCSSLFSPAVLRLHKQLHVALLEPVYVIQGFNSSDVLLQNEACRKSSQQILRTAADGITLLKEMYITSFVP